MALKSRILLIGIKIPTSSLLLSQWTLFPKPKATEFLSWSLPASSRDFSPLLETSIDPHAGFDAAHIGGWILFSLKRSYLVSTHRTEGIKQAKQRRDSPSQHRPPFFNLPAYQRKDDRCIRS